LSEKAFHPLEFQTDYPHLSVKTNPIVQPILIATAHGCYPTSSATAELYNILFNRDIVVSKEVISQQSNILVKSSDRH
jgi:hypothetical protein